MNFIVFLESGLRGLASFLSYFHCWTVEAVSTAQVLPKPRELAEVVVMMQWKIGGGHVSPRQGWVEIGRSPNRILIRELSRRNIDQNVET
ncbi:hypothetical protein EV356DRAFT_345953 [Viridothelium virens]|uniref:Uncharacterized protein n=1 Tax=Viridothelium virens TaxID=1048519 RepID=A0A6A6GX91_VIRVR|nr:hypothetical protein EV356DRAFT_345953 [Viridothelium virens]